jgi:hypothetical protein
MINNNKKNLYLLFLSIFLLSSCSVQRKDNYINGYFPKIYDADIAYEEKKYKKAYKIYKNVFKYYKPRNTKTFYEIEKMIRTSAVLSKNHECYKFIKIQLRDEGFTIIKYKADTLYNNFFKSKYGITLLKESDSLRSTYLKKIDTILINKLVKMSEKDQMYRISRSKYNEFIKTQNHFDSINKIYIKEILESSGFPKEHFNRYANPRRINFEVILLHTDRDFRFNYLLPKILQDIKNGLCDPLIYAELNDQYLIYNNNKQKYGTYLDRNNKIANHISLDSIDMNRQKIGLPSLEKHNKIIQLKIINYPDTFGKLYKN